MLPEAEVSGEFVRTDDNALAIVSGVLVSREHSTNETGEQPKANEAEALFHMEYEMYTFKSSGPESVINAYVSI